MFEKYCRDVDGCPIDHFHMATYSSEFETKSIIMKIRTRYLFVVYLSNWIAIIVSSLSGEKSSP